jgi:hypothetical protein
MAVDFRRKQAEFAAYIRDPLRNPPPDDVAPERMAMYHELFFNNMDSFISSNFPVLRKILPDRQWYALVHDFFAEHRCNTPHFSEIAEEFLDYLQTRNHAEDFPFLLELAHYEWVEMAVAIAPTEPPVVDPSFADELLDQEIALSPLAWLLAYQYPVQQISPDFLPTSPPAQPTFLIVYRDDDYAVHFVQPSPLTFRLLQLLEQHPNQTGTACLQALITEAQHIDPQLLRAEGVKILKEMAGKGIIIPGRDA